MRLRNSAVLTVGISSLLTFIPVSMHAQITNEIEATISHSFIVSTKTLPPGKYTFRMQQGSDGGIMTVTSADGKNSDDFMVRESEASNTPAHTEVFRRYGNKEFLSKVYEGGNKIGVAMSEPSKLEKELIAQGQQPKEHTESGGE